MVHCWYYGIYLFKVKSIDWFLYERNTGTWWAKALLSVSEGSKFKPHCVIGKAEGPNFVTKVHMN